MNYPPPSYPDKPEWIDASPNDTPATPPPFAVEPVAVTPVAATPIVTPPSVAASPAAFVATPVVAPADAGAHSAEASGRWIGRWRSFKWVLFLVAAVGVTRWVTWRQSVAYQPPLELSAVARPTLSPGASALAGVMPPASKAMASTRKIFIHIIGAVKKPGVFEMGPGMRLKDALHWAGGVLPGADLEAINLAEVLEDGRKYSIPMRLEPRAASATEAAPQIREDTTPRPRPAERAPQDPERTPKPRKASTKAPPAPLDLNASSLAELQQLPGVGPAMAQRIVDYRNEIGGFKTVDDLDGVRGIGPKKMEKIRPYALVR